MTNPADTRLDARGSPLPVTPCPNCGKRLSAATDPRGVARPSVGDYTVCIGCASVFVFGDDMSLVPPPDEPLPPQVVAAVATMVSWLKNGRRFSVWQFLVGGQCLKEPGHEGLSAWSAVATANRLTQTLGARIGSTCRIVITDGDDKTVWEWRHGEGLVFIKPEASTPEV